MTTIIAAIVIGWIAGIVLFNIGTAVAGQFFGFPTESFVIGQGPKLLASMAASNSGCCRSAAMCASVLGQTGRISSRRAR